MTLRRTTELLTARGMPQRDPQAIAAIDGLREALIRLHKALIDAERVHYERIFGRVENELTLLRLIERDPQFAWLRPVMRRIVEIDEFLASDDPLSVADAARVGDGIRSLLARNERGDEFARNYHRALQSYPEVVMAHGSVMRLLPTTSSAPE